MGNLNWGKRACAVVLLCVTTAVALRAQSFTALHSASITPVVPNETIALPAQTFRTLHSFDGTDGAGPLAALVQATDGNLYGTTQVGGANDTCNSVPFDGCGTFFKITLGGTLTTLYSFCSQSGCPDGANPSAGLVQATSGNLYGTTSYGGANYYGMVFKITLGGTLTTLYSFCSESDCTDGEFAHGLVQATNGNFYGTTYGGGANSCIIGVTDYGCGTFFKITPSGTLTTLYSFCSQSGCTDGEFPLLGLVQATNGNFYGTTVGGGAQDWGTVFKITPSGTLTTLYSFCSQIGCTDGETPQAGLVQATDGNFYGTTTYGGAYGSGTVFKITPGGTLTTLYSFCSQSHCPDGCYPIGSLVQATDGNLYGTTYGGGANSCTLFFTLGCGTVFKIAPSGTLTTLHSFCSQTDCADGLYPEAGLVQATDGNFYGTTFEGGANDSCVSMGANGGCGTVFSLSVGLGPFVETQPTSGEVGVAVKILGTSLTDATRVTFNGHAAAFKVVSNSLITTAVPAGATTGAVEVVTPSGTLLSNVPFQVPPSFSPESTGREEPE
jgi:uncharacterized repeat protein (TIGR03803 family)